MTVAKRNSLVSHAQAAISSFTAFPDKHLGEVRNSSILQFSLFEMKNRLQIFQCQLEKQLLQNQKIKVQCLLDKRKSTNYINIELEKILFF